MMTVWHTVLAAEVWAVCVWCGRCGVCGAKKRWFCEIIDKFAVVKEKHVSYGSTRNNEKI